jgi:hypothetical protein
MSGQEKSPLAGGLFKNLRIDAAGTAPRGTINLNEQATDETSVHHLALADECETCKNNYSLSSTQRPAGLANPTARTT